VIGLENTRHHLEHLARKSKNRFYAIDVAAGKIHHLEPGQETFALHAAKEMEKRRSAEVG
jgi:diphthamide synthase subunit DPH2